MREEQALGIFSLMNAVREGHVRLASGRHAGKYVQKDRLFPHVRWVRLLCEAIANHFACQRIDVVAAPATGGIILSQHVAYFLTGMRAWSRETLAIYAERDILTGRLEFRREYDLLIPGRNVLVVEDVLTTGGSVSEVIGLVRKWRGNVAGVGALWNRGGVSAESLGVLDLYATVNWEFPSWLPEECPFCRDGIPLDDAIGHGRNALPEQIA